MQDEGEQGMSCNALSLLNLSPSHRWHDSVRYRTVARPDPLYFLYRDAAPDNCAHFRTATGDRPRATTNRSALDLELLRSLRITELDRDPWRKSKVPIDLAHASLVPSFCFWRNRGRMW